MTKNRRKFGNRPGHFLLASLMAMFSMHGHTAEPGTATPVPFVMQLTRSAEGLSHRRAFLQIAKVLDEIGEDKLHIEVVAYEELGMAAIFKIEVENSPALIIVDDKANDFSKDL